MALRETPTRTPPYLRPALHCGGFCFSGASILHRMVDGTPGKSGPAINRLIQSAIRVHRLLQSRDREQANENLRAATSGGGRPAAPERGSKRNFRFAPSEPAVIDYVNSCKKLIRPASN